MTAAAAGAATSAGGASRSRRFVPWVLAGVGILLVVVAAGGGSQQGTPFDPQSSGPDGTKAFVELLGGLGAKVDVTDQQPPADVDVAVAFPNTIPDERVDAMRRWVADGHTLVLADPKSDLNPYSGLGSQLSSVITPTIDRGNCTIGALRNASQISVDGDVAESVAGRLYQAPADAPSCFTLLAQTALNSDPEQFDAIVSAPTGTGQIVALGLPAIWTNGHLGEADNAVVAADLLAPRPGTRVAVLSLPPGTTGSSSLSSLISVGVKLALLQLTLALVVYVFARGRRLGKPVLESQLVQIPGSELVSAVGNLLQQTKSPDRAAYVLRADLRRRLGERLGLPVGTSPEVLAASVEARVGLPQQDVLPVVADVACPTEADLLTLSARIDELRRTVLGGR